MIYFIRQELGKISTLYKVAAQSVFSFQSKILRPLPVTQTCTESVPICREQTPYGQPVECRFSKSAATSVAFLLIARGFPMSEHFMSWLLYNRGSGTIQCARYLLCSGHRQHNKLMKRSIRVVKVHPCLQERTVTI